MKQAILYILLTMGCAQLKAVEIDIRIYSNQQVKQAVVTTDTGLYYLLALNENLEQVDTIYDIFPQDSLRTFYLASEGNNIFINRGKERLGRYTALVFTAKNPEKEFRIDANRKGRIYHGDVRFTAKGGELIVVNRVDLEKYVAGVVESEAGHVDQLEFYKAQSVLVRTFAMKNYNKHIREGYNLKDDVTSQVYFSKAHYTNHEIIEQAVEATSDTVLVMPDCKPVLSVFHANSGGYTSNSEDVWLRPVDYLKSKPDSFSVDVGSFNWEREITASRFFAFFADKLGVENDINLQKALLNFEQEYRCSHFEYRGKKLKLTEVRRHFSLRSTFFSIEKKGDLIVLKGRGYGHGVGLSQDGAIEMSRRGFDYKSILEFYFTGVELESVKQLDI